MTETDDGRSSAAAQRGPMRAMGGSLKRHLGLISRRCLELLGHRLPPPGPDLSAVMLEIAFEEVGCPFCRLGRRTARRWLWMFLWESVTDPERRAVIRASDGFCPAHWWLLNTVEREGGHSRSGGAIIAEDIISTRSARLRAGNVRQAAGAACPVCQVERRSEDMAVDAAARHLTRPAFRERYAGGDGACLTHTRALLERINDSQIGQLIISRWSERAGTLASSQGEPQRLADLAAHVSRATEPPLR